MTRRFRGLLLDHRQRCGLTQEQLAERTGLAARTIRRLESGGLANPRADTVRRIADAFGLSPDERRDLFAAADDHPEDERPTRARSVPQAVSDAADHLALVIEPRLRDEEEHLRLHDPVALPLRWRPATEWLGDHWANIRDSRVGATTPSPLELTGDLDDIAGTYRRIPSGRLVVLGGAGAGKSVLALRFAGDILRGRAHGDPVPVLVSLGSWNPTTTSLRSWLTGMLLRDHPALARAVPGGTTLADALVSTGQVLPVLDGFDELAPGLRVAALRALNITSLPFLLTSRGKEYEDAVADVDVLTRAAVVELVALTPDDLIHYLPRTARPTTGDNGRGASATAWDGVLRALRERPRSPANARLSQVLITPLMVSLARTVYSDAARDPAELLDADRFPTAPAIEAHLLDNFLPTVYRESAGRPRCDTDRVTEWLTYLADHLRRRDTTDLAWWHLVDAVRPAARVRTVAAACAVVATLVYWLLITPVTTLLGVDDFAWQYELLGGGLSGVVIGSAFGLIHWLTAIRGRKPPEPVRVRAGLLGRAGRPHGHGRKVASRFTAGLLAGCVVGVGIAFVFILIRQHDGLPDLVTVLGVLAADIAFYGTLLGISIGTALAAIAALEVPMDVSSATSPVEFLNANRTTVLHQAAIFIAALALTINLGGHLLAATLPGPFTWSAADTIHSAGGAIIGGAGYTLAGTSWGQWLLMARLRLPLTGRLPWNTTAFLEDAYRRGVLRRSGAVYQFRHARLRDHLAVDHSPDAPGE